MAEQQFSIEELSGEEWRPVAGREEMYEISSIGRLKSHFHKSGPRLRALCAAGNDYLHVSLWMDGRYVNCPIHVLVAAAFLGERPEGMVVNHLDGDHKNNRASNLEYTTCAGNTQHAARLGLSFSLSKGLADLSNGLATEAEEAGP